MIHLLKSAPALVFSNVSRTIPQHSTLGTMWRFVRQIIPLLLVGVFLAGMARTIISAIWIQALAGRNTGKLHEAEHCPFTAGK
jgi:uncharacterized membrane protein YraQ (UPF0718 family)